MRRAHQCPHQILLREREILVTCFQRYIYIPAHTQIPRQNVSVCSGTNEIDFPSVSLSLSHPSFSIPTRLPLSLLCSGYGKGGTQLIRPSLNLFRLSLSRWFHSHRSMFLLVPAETENGKERSVLVERGPWEWGFRGWRMFRRTSSLRVVKSLRADNFFVSDNF